MTGIITVRNLAIYFLGLALISVLPRIIDSGIDLVNQLIGISILAGCIGLMVTRLHEATYRLWHPLTWFLATSAAYYGFGSLVYYYATPETVDYINTFYAIDEYLLWRINLITLISIAGVLYMHEGIVTAKAKFQHSILRTPSLGDASDLILYRTATLFLIVGLPLQLFIVLPADLSDSTEIIAGIWRQLGNFALMGLLPLLELSRRRAPYSRMIFLAVLVIELSSALITFSKTEVLKVCIILMLGGVLLNMKLRTLAVAGLLTGAIFSAVLVPLVMYGRTAFNVRGISSVGDVSALAGDVYGGRAAEELALQGGRTQLWWARMSYSNAQGFAIEAYDKGESGDTFALVFWTIIPRIIYPDKPITNTGARFNELVNGNPESKSAPGMFAEGYWNLGLIGLGVVVVVLGAFIGYWEKFIDDELYCCRYEQLPVMWMGLFPAIQQDSWFIPGTVGIIPFALVLYWMLRLIFSGTPKRRFEKS